MHAAPLFNLHYCPAVSCACAACWWTYTRTSLCLYSLDTRTRRTYDRVPDRVDSAQPRIVRPHRPTRLWYRTYTYRPAGIQFVPQRTPCSLLCVVSFLVLVLMLSDSLQFTCVEWIRVESQHKWCESNYVQTKPYADGFTSVEQKSDMNQFLINTKLMVYLICDQNLSHQRIKKKMPH